MGKKLLITGAAGSYGNAVLELAEKWGYETIPTDVRLVKHARFQYCDISNEESVKTMKSIIGPVDAVIHIAGVIDINAVELHKKVHLDGTRNLINVFGKDDECKVFISVSSGAIHGGTEEYVMIKEDHGRELNDSYTESKALQYDLTLELIKEKAIITQPALVYDERNRYMFKEIAEIAALNLMLILPEQGNYRVSLVHPKDLATGTLMLLERGEFGESYIISDDYPLRIKEMVQLVQKETGARLYDPKRSIKSESIERLMDVIGRLRKNLPSLAGMEPLGSMMEELGLDLSGGITLPMDPKYMITHHALSNEKIKEVTKRNNEKWRINEDSLKYFKGGWKPQINPFFELPKVVQYWIETGVIKSNAGFVDFLEYLMDAIGNFINR
ncbi:MAG: NAD-dependent epimerase/dehydratase family protein [Candidatus Helarchaeota archaeon]